MAGFDWKTGLGGIGSIGSGLMGLFGEQNNPADAAMGYLNQIPGQTKQTQPWLEAGQRQLPGLEKQYGDLMNTPGQKLNEIGGQFQQSPGFKFALQQALQGGNQAAAAGGMAGSPMHEQNNMQLATDLANQDYYKWLQGATGLYGAGLQGSQGMANQGQQAGQSQADLIAQMLAQQANLSYAGEQAKNQQKGGAFSDILGGLGGLLGMFI
jgi:hypothetical protein